MEEDQTGVITCEYGQNELQCRSFEITSKPDVDSPLKLKLKLSKESVIEVRFADGQIRKANVKLKKETILDLKSKIFKDEIKSKECELIYMGKFLTDN